MKALRWSTLLVTVSLIFSGCTQTGSKGDPAGPTPGPVNPVPPPGPGPVAITVVSNLTDENITSVHTCMLNSWNEDSAYWASAGGADLLKCLTAKTRIQESDLTAQFEIDFSNLFNALHDQNGHVLTNISIGTVRRAIGKGERK